METRKLFREISRLRTTDLLITKMDCTRRVYLFKSLKLGLLGLLGIFIGQIAKTLLAGQEMTTIDVISSFLAIYCVIGYLIFDSHESNYTALKELICDLLAIRSSRTGKKS